MRALSNECSVKCNDCNKERHGNKACGHVHMSWKTHSRRNAVLRLVSAVIQSILPVRTPLVHCSRLVCDHLIYVTREPLVATTSTFRADGFACL